MRRAVIAITKVDLVTPEQARRVAAEAVGFLTARASRQVRPS